MPIYEYYCPDNNKIYSFYARSIEQGKQTPECPDNPEYRMVKLVSGFAIGNANKKAAEAAANDGSDEGGVGEDAGLDDPRMMSAMADMEKEFSSLDEDNPDPRLMARMMRRMSEATGEKMDEGMEEMVRKLEEGQDPEKLEEELGDVLGDGDDSGGGGGGGFGAPPMRDPTLYDY